MSELPSAIGRSTLANAYADTHAGAAVGDYVAILKPRVMSLVVFTGFVGLFLAPGHLHPVLAAVAVLCIAIGAGASGAINMWYDRDIDAVMRRTAGRPLPAGRMLPGEALGFGVVLASGAVVIMGLAVNWVAAELLALTIGFYVFVYTMWLKRRTPQNIVIGGAAGALPPIVGWAAVTGDVGWGAVALFAIIFFWTPPHFWALSLYRSGEYAAAGVPMLPVVAGPRETKRQMLLYTLSAVAGDAGPVPARHGGTAIRPRRLRTQHPVHRDFRQSVARGRRGRRTRRAVHVPFLAAVPVSDLRHAARGPRRGRGR